LRQRQRRSSIWRFYSGQTRGFTGQGFNPNGGGVTLVADAGNNPPVDINEEDFTEDEKELIEDMMNDPSALICGDSPQLIRAPDGTFFAIPENFTLLQGGTGRLEGVGFMQAPDGTVFSTPILNVIAPGIRDDFDESATEVSLVSAGLGIILGSRLGFAVISFGTGAMTLVPRVQFRIPTTENCQPLQ